MVSNERLAAWCFCSSTQEPEIEIVCVVPFSSDTGNKTPSHVLVGLDTGLNGMVAVFDITGNIFLQHFKLLGNSNSTFFTPSRKSSYSCSGSSSQGWQYCYGLRMWRSVDTAISSSCLVVLPWNCRGGNDGRKNTLTRFEYG